MGRVVKGAHVAQQAYLIKPPPIRVPQPEYAVPHEDDASFAQLHGHVRDFSPTVSFEAPTVNIDAARAEAAKLIEDASADAERLLQDARQRALQLIDDAERGVRDIEELAKKSGFDQGVADGRAAAQAEMDEMLETMRGLIEMARIERHKIIESAEPEIVRLSVSVAERILNGHVALAPDTVLDMVRSAITRLVNRETVTVRVNPADIETMRGHRERLMAMNDIDNVRLIEDQRVDRGGVIIETDAGSIDAKISTQLREARRLLAVEEPITVAPSNEPELINPTAQAS